MPPVYKPLTSAGGIQGAPGLPPAIFGDPGVPTLEEAMQVRAVQRAQELSNQSNEIAVANRQIQFDQEQAQRDALKAQYTQENQTNFNPEEALHTAQRIALQNGDLDTALAVENATRNNFRTDGQVLTPTQRQFLSPALGGNIPEGITTKDISLRESLERGINYNKQISERIGNRRAEIESYAPGGFRARIDPETGQGPTKKDGDSFMATTVAHSRINSDLDALEVSMRISDGNDPSHPEFAKQRAIIADIMVALKDKNNFGAALSANEQAISNAGLPEMLARPDVGAAQALIATGLGRDPFEAINTMRSLLSTDFDQQAILYKFEPNKDSEGLPAAQSGTSFRIPKVNSSVGRGEGTLTPDEAAYKEQYKAKLRAKRSVNGFK